MTMKTTSSADHSGGSWNKDRITVFFGMKAVEDISVASGTPGIVKQSCIIVVGIVIVDDYRIMKRTNWGSRSRRAQMIRRTRRKRWSLRSLKGRREQRQIRWYCRWRNIRSSSWMMISSSSHVDYRSKDVIESVLTSFFKSCFCEFVKEGDFIYFNLSSSFCFFLLLSDCLSEQKKGRVVIAKVSVASK